MNSVHLLPLSQTKTRHQLHADLLDRNAPKSFLVKKAEQLDLWSKVELEAAVYAVKLPLSLPKEERESERFSPVNQTRFACN
jgi:hypothetical protein